MKILVAGATGSIGIHVVNTAIAMGHQPVALVRNRRKIKLLPRGTDIFYGDVSIPETLTDLPKDIDAIIFTLGSDGQGRIGARAIDYGGVRNILRIFMDTPVRIALMTTIGVTERLSSWNQRTEVHDWKRRSERLVRACGHIYKSEPVGISTLSSDPAGLITTMMMSTESSCFRGTDAMRGRRKMVLSPGSKSPRFL